MRYVILSLGAAISILLSRTLAAEGRGSYAYVIAVASTVLWVSHMSVETSLMINWSSVQQRSSLVGAAIAAAISLGIAAIAVGMAWLFVIAGDLPKGVSVWMLIVGLGITPISLMAVYANAILANDGRIESINWAAFLSTATQLLVIVGLVLFDTLTVGSAVLVWTGGAAMPVFLLFSRIRRKPGIDWSGWKSVWELVSVGLKYHPGAVALALVFRVDILILGDRVGTAQLGIYSLAVALVEMSLIATSAASQVAIQVQVRGKPGDQAPFAASVSRANLVLGLAVLTALIVTGPFLISRVFGPSFAGTSEVIFVLAPGVIALSVIRPIGVYLTRLERPGLIALITGTALGANVVLNLLWIPSLGIAGAAAASSVSYFGLLISLLAWFHRSSGLPVRSLFPTRSDVRGVLRVAEAPDERQQ